MSEENRAKYYMECLEEIVHILCEASGVDPERYDTDQSDYDCYLDCAREAAEILKRSGVRFNHEDSCFEVPII